MLMTGVHLGEKLALTGSRYSTGDCLLTHDDKLEVISTFTLLSLGLVKYMDRG